MNKGFQAIYKKEDSNDEKNKEMDSGFAVRYAGGGMYDSCGGHRAYVCEANSSSGI